MLAVVALIGIVFFVALNFYTDLSRATVRASHHTHDVRRAAAILDRVARDFESAMLVVKPPEMDPIEHPWLFVGESQLGGPGADHVKFVTRNHDPNRTDNPESDLAVVAYTVDKDEFGTLSLYRWSSPRLPDSLDRSFPFADADGSYLMADELEQFGVEFIGPDGAETETWDSTTIDQSSSLPSAVELRVAIAPADPDDDSEPRVYRRRVPIPVRPIDMEQLLNPAPAGGPTAGNNTLGDCVDVSGVDPNDQVSSMWLALYSSQQDAPFDRSMVASLPPGAVVKPGCQ